MLKTSELFTDLQISMTEIVLLEMIDRRLTQEETQRLSGNIAIVATIKGLMNDRFNDENITDFLQHGYPREVDLGVTLPSPA